MTTITEDANLAFRDKNGSSLWNPRKSDIRPLFARIDNEKVARSTDNVALVDGMKAQAAIAEANDPIINVSPYYGDIDFGGFWKSVSLSVIDNTFAHAGQTQAGHTFVSRSSGSGANGPANASFAVGALSYKLDWQTSLEPGEVDTFYLNMRQGLSSDGGGVLNSGKKVFAHGGNVADYVSDGVETAYDTASPIPVAIPGSIVNWPVAVFVTDDTGKHRVFSGIELTRDSGTGIGTVTFDTPPAVLKTNLTANGSASSFSTDFAVLDALLDELKVYVSGVLQTKKADNEPSSPDAGYTVATSASTGFVTVTFYNASGVLAPPANGLSVDLELAPVIEIYETSRRTLIEADGVESSFESDFAVPGITPTFGEVVVFVNNVRQTRKLNNLPESPDAGFVVARDPVTGFVTVTFYDGSGVLAPPADGYEVRLDLAYDGGVTTNEWNAYDLVTWGIGSDRQITYTRKKVQGVTGFVEGYDGRNTYVMGQWQEAQAGNVFAAYHCATADGSFGTAGSSPFYDWILYYETARPVFPQARTTYQAFGVFGNGTKILMGPSGINRKYISADGGSLKIRDSADANTLLEVHEDGDVIVANRMTVNAGIMIPGTGYTVAFLNGVVGEYPNGSLAYSTNGLAGSPTWAERKTAGWCVIGTNTLISAT